MEYNTNVYTSGPLAAVYQAQDQSAKAGAADLQNLIKGMSLPGEQLKMQEQQMLLQDPNYLQQKTANTFIELQNTYNANQFQQTLNEVGRARLALQASGGDPRSLYAYAEKLGAKPGDALFQAIDKNPNAVLDKYEQALTQMMANAGGTKFAGEMAKQKAGDVAAMERTQAQIEGHHLDARIAAGSHANTAGQSELNAAFRDNTSNINNVRSQLTKFATAEAQADTVRQLVGTGMTQKAAESVVSAEKKRLTDELNTLQAQRQHLQKQSKVYSGFNFNQTPAPTGGAGGGSYTYDPEKGLVPQ